MQVKTYGVEGMTCASCAQSVESMLGAQEGVEQAIVNFADNSVKVKYEEEKVKEESLAKAIKDIGYKLLVGEENEREEQSKNSFQKTKVETIAAVILATPVFVLGMFIPASFTTNIVAMLLTLVVMAWPGRRFFINAFKRLRFGQTNMDTLVALSTAIAFIYSAINTLFPTQMAALGLKPVVYFESAAIIIAFILIGKFLEERAKHQSGDAIRKLMALQPDEVTVLRNGEEIRIPRKELVAYDRLVVKAAAKIPVDGKVIKGHSYVDESMVTGEPVPVEKQKGDELFAGTINQNGTLTILAEKVGEDTLLAQIIETVKNAQGSKAPIQKRADKIASVFVPVVLVIAVLTFLAWFFVGGKEQFPFAITAAISVLVIACPCALGLATPTALMVGIGKAAQQGILIKDAEQLEQTKNTRHLVLDKTGTITEGKPRVLSSKWYSDDDKHKALLYGAEKQSDHPLANAICKALESEVEKAESPAENEALPGKGLLLKNDESAYMIGHAQWLKDEGVAFKEDQENFLQEQRSQGVSLVLFAKGPELLAIYALADSPKKEAKEAIAKLAGLGLQIHMLTGDQEAAAHWVAKQTGISNVKAQATPSDKAAYIKELKSDGSTVAMVGDGINDAEALALSDVSIAMGKGTDIAMDVAGITLMHGDLKALHKAFKVSVETSKTIKQNLFWAFIYNLICIPIAAGVIYPFTGIILSPMIAGAAMAFSSVSVVSNSLLLKRKKLA